MQLRMTYQTKLVLQIAQNLGHAKNATILELAREQLPELSATTVHRITVRLVAAGMLANGPELKGARIIDANTMPHDHFICEACDGIKDIVISDQSRAELQQQVNAFISQSRLTILGDCKQCAG